MQSILDFSSPLDLPQFEAVIQAMYGGDARNITEAQEVLTQFKEHPQAVERAAQILSTSTLTPARYFALQVLDSAILTRWNTFEPDQQLEIRNFLLNLIVQECATVESMRSQKVLLTKINTTLVSIAKREWPHRWPTFIQDICGASTVSSALAENSISLLRIVGEEIFEFGETSMTSRWIQRKKEAMQAEFSSIFQLCLQGLSADDMLLVQRSLETMEKFIMWANLSVVLQPTLMEFLGSYGIAQPMVRCVSVRCLKEICSLCTNSASAQAERVSWTNVGGLFRTAFESICQVLPTSHSDLQSRIVEQYQSGVEDHQCFVREVVQLVTIFLKNHVLDIAHDIVLLTNTHNLLVGATHIDDKENFKVCIEYWWFLGDVLSQPKGARLLPKLTRILSDVRYGLIKRMMKPEEVIIVEEDGELKRVYVQDDAENMELYRLMKEALVFLTHLDPADTTAIMGKLMERQIDGSEWSWQACSSLSWAVGAISGAMNAQEEREFFTMIIRDLLNLCRDMQGTENRAVIASNIMFVCGQYPRYLNSFPRFFYVVLAKLFEFMHESFPGVKDMAVDTFYKLLKRLPEVLLLPRPGLEDTDGNAAQGGLHQISSCFALEKIRVWDKIVDGLQPEQVQRCYAAMGFCVRELSSEGSGEAQRGLLEALLEKPTEQFKLLAKEAGADPSQTLPRRRNFVLSLLHVLRIFSGVAETSGTGFIHEMNFIFNDLHGFYALFCTAINRAIAEDPNAAYADDARYMRLIKKEILNTIAFFVEFTEQKDFVAKNCMPSVLNVVLKDYHDSHPNARDAAALGLVTACVKKLGPLLLNDCAAILECTFMPTVSMICHNYEDFPEYRIHLFQLLQALSDHCFEAFVTYASQQEEVLNSMLWALKHVEQNTMRIGLEALDSFLQRVTLCPFAMPFYTAYLPKIFSDVLVATMDALHASGFHLHCKILMQLFQVSQSVDPALPVVGKQAVYTYFETNLQAIVTLSPAQIHAFVSGCYDACQSTSQFETLLADFLIEVKTWGAEQENMLLREEEAHKRAATFLSFSGP